MKSNQRFSLRGLGATLVGSLILAACATAQPAKGRLDVEWFEGFGMGHFLEPPRELVSQSDVTAAIDSPWDYDRELAIYTADGELERPAFVLGSCADYLALQKRAWPVHTPDSDVFTALAMTCKAAKVIASAEPAERSFVRGLAFDRDLPGLLPPELTIAVSSSEVERVGAARVDESWDDLAGIARHESCHSREGEHCGIYYDDTAGRQQVQLVARGDFNADGIEDVLISSGDSLEGGSYWALRMFVLTRRSTDGDYELLEQLDY